MLRSSFKCNWWMMIAQQAWKSNELGGRNSWAGNFQPSYLRGLAL